MIRRLFSWMRTRDRDDRDDRLDVTGAYRSSVDKATLRPTRDRQPTAKQSKPDQPVDLPAASQDSLIRNRYLREDTGTHETLKILDDSLIQTGEDEGFDPYNTGDFDRSRNWEKRFKS